MLPKLLKEPGSARLLRTNPKEMKCHSRLSVDGRRRCSNVIGRAPGCGESTVWTRFNDMCLSPQCAAQRSRCPVPSGADMLTPVRS